MKTINLIIILVISLFLSAWYSVDFIKYSEETYSATTSVDVFRNKPVDREYIELGELSLRVKKGIFSNQESVVLKLKEKAKEIGADAIIILGEESEGSVIVPIGDLYTSVDKRYIIAIAIRYKNWNAI